MSIFIDQLHEEGDYSTADYAHFFQFGVLVVKVPNGEDWRPHVKAHMDRERFWSDVWYISDHGNEILLSLTEKSDVD